MVETTKITQTMETHFGAWGITNYKDDYSHLIKSGAEVSKADEAKQADARLHNRCHAFAGRRKSKNEVMAIGADAFRNGGGVCTTSAFAVAAKLHEAGVKDRIEIIGQGTLDNGHMWVVVGREGTSVRTGTIASRRWHPVNTHDKWGDYCAVDAWVKAFGWGNGVYPTPAAGKHHFFIDNDINKLEITYDSLMEDGDD